MTGVVSGGRPDRLIIRGTESEQEIIFAVGWLRAHGPCAREALVRLNRVHP